MSKGTGKYGIHHYKTKKKDNKTVQSSIATLWQSNLGL